MGEVEASAAPADAAPVKKKKVPVFALLAVFIFVVVTVGLPILMIVGALQERNVTTPVKNGITTTGTVVGVREDPVVGRAGGSEYAEIRFTDLHGESHEFEATSTSSTPDIGSHVKVSYDPNDPTKAADLSVGWLRWITFMTIGVALLLGEVYFVYRAYIKGRRARAAKA